jgi:nuclear GTP-binding protein
LIDCPGVVGGSQHDEEVETVLKGVIRVEKLEEPSAYVAEVLKRVKTKYIARTYGITSWTRSIDFLEQLSRKSGKLLKGGEPDLKTTSRMVCPSTAP